MDCKENGIWIHSEQSHLVSNKKEERHFIARLPAALHNERVEGNLGGIFQQKSALQGSDAF